MTTRQPRTIAWGWVFPLVLAWMIAPIFILLFLPKTTAADRTADGGFYVTPRGLLWGLVVPEALSLIVPIVVVTALGWWRRVNRDSVPTARWVLVVPLLMVVPSLVFVRYGAFADRGAAFFGLIVLGVLLVALSEELMFRGLAVEMLRGGLSEPWVAVISTLLFALGHAIRGDLAIVAVISAVMGGYLYYLTRRATVFLVFPVLVHASYDLFIFSRYGANDDTGFYLVLCGTALFVAVIALSRFISPASVRAQRRAKLDRP